MNQEVLNLWNQFLNTYPELSHMRGRAPDVWKFGGTPEGSDKLLSLVLEGKKTATCSLLRLYNETPEDLPRAGTYSLIVDSSGRPGCVVFLTDTFVRRFNEIDAKHAFEEGEGDRSLEHWRKVHREFFNRYDHFDESEYLLCERFIVRSTLIV